MINVVLLKALLLQLISQPIGNQLFRLMGRQLSSGTGSSVEMMDGPDILFLVGQKPCEIQRSKGGRKGMLCLFLGSHVKLHLQRL